jgi:hypothetical protein
MKREEWLPIALGLMLGLAIGLYYSWVLNPVEFVETSPASMRDDFKADYLALIASAYTYSGDLARAEARIAIFREPNPAVIFSELAQTRLAMGRPQSETRAIALMAAALGDRPTPRASVAADTKVASPSAIQSTRTPTRTPLPPPTKTLTPTPGAPYGLLDQEKVCDPDLYAPLIQVVVIDAAGRAVPGVEVLVVWDTGQDHFFTGLKPELGLGYGDFTMTEGVIYTVQVVKSESPITGLTAEDCFGDEDELFPGSWLLTFQQPELP